MFDPAGVAASLLPQAGAFVMVARLTRLMRVTRLGLLLYVSGILGFYLFATRTNNLESAQIELRAGEDGIAGTRTPPCSRRSRR